MRRTILLTLLLLTLPARAEPPGLALRARWTGPGQAVISWQQPAGVRLTCLSRQPSGGQAVQLRCWPDLPPGTMAMRLGGPLTDAAYRPSRGDTYVLRLGGEDTRAPLESRWWLPLALR